jgi:hypothetical protein
MKKLFIFLFLGLFMFSFTSAWTDNGSAIQTLNGCGELSTANAKYELTQNISSSSTCIEVLAANVTLNGNGYTINYGGVGEGDAGIIVSNTEAKIYNISIIQNNDAVGISDAIYVNANYLNLYNSYLKTYSFNSMGIYFDTSSYSKIENNNIYTYGELSQGIYFYGSSEYTNISNNNIYTYGYSSNGILLESGGKEKINNNYINNNGWNSNGIKIEGNINNIFNNYINTTNYLSSAILLISTDNILTNNTLSSKIENALTITSSNNNTFNGLLIKDSRRAINISSYNVTFNNTIFLDSGYTSIFNETNIRAFSKVENAILNFSVFLVNGSPCSIFNYSIDIYPKVNYSSTINSNKLTINITNAVNGIITLKVNITNQENIKEARSYKVLHGDNIKKVSQKIYFSAIEPTHGQPLAIAGYDSGTLNYTLPSGEQERHCSQWVQFGPNEIINQYFIIDSIYSQFYYNSSGNPLFGIEKYNSYGKYMDYNSSISNSTNYQIGSVNLSNLNVPIDYTSWFYYLSMKLSGVNPSLKSNSTLQSYIQLSYLTSGADILELKEHNESSITDMNLLSNVWNNDDKTNVSLMFEGEGSLFIALNISNLSEQDYAVYYDGIDCVYSNDCEINSNSNGLINLTLSLNSVHNLDIYKEEIIVNGCNTITILLLTLISIVLSFVLLSMVIMSVKDKKITTQDILTIIIITMVNISIIIGIPKFICTIK